jgi:membrane-bound lytic murein transglycosylase F
MILNLSNPKYYQHALSRHGYLRGVETYSYVREIFIRFNEYKTAFPDENEIG